MSTFSINGADGVIVQVPAGEYYFNTKARARRMMLNSLSLEARQIYACLELATMGFQQELAVTMANGKKILLTNAHIQDQTALSKQNVRRGLAELEAAGLVERRGIAGGPLHKGKIEIYCWAEPREPKEKRESRPTTIPVWFPTSWEPFKPLIRRFKLQLLSDLGVQRDYVLAEGEELALRLQNTEKVVVSFLNGVCAAAPLNKDERTERTGRERTPPPPYPPPQVEIILEEEEPPPSIVEPEPPPATPEPAAVSTEVIPASPNSWETFKSLYPKERLDWKAKAKFKAMPAAERIHALQQLIRYMQSERWNDQDGRWIPNASNWLETYEVDPPPLIRLANIKEQKVLADLQFTLKAYTAMYGGKK